MGYRSTVAIASTGHSPFYILYGRNMKLPIDNQILPLPSTGVRTADEYIQKMLPKLQLAREVAQENVRSHQEQSKNRYDTNIRVVAYKPGDKCWLYDPKTPKGKSKKLILRWHGPYFVLRQTGISNYMLADCTTKKAIPYAVNVERMKPFNDTRDVFHNYDSSRYDFEAHTPGNANTSSDTMSPTVPHAVNDTQVPSNNNSDSTVVTNTGTDTQITNRVQPSIPDIGKLQSHFLVLKWKTMCVITRLCGRTQIMSHLGFLRMKFQML